MKNNKTINNSIVNGANETLKELGKKFIKQEIYDQFRLACIATSGVVKVKKDREKE